jgi:hypothetical protein
MSKGSTKYAPIFNGLWDIKHVQRMGMAVFLFGELLDRVGNKGQLQITYRELSDKTGISTRTLERWMQKLKSGNYIYVQGKNPMIVKIANFRLIKNGRFEHENIPSNVAGPDALKPPEVAGSKEHPIPSNVAETLQDVAGPNSASLLNSDSSKPLLKYKNNKRQTSKKSDGFVEEKIKEKRRQFSYSNGDTELAILMRDKIKLLKPDPEKYKEPNLEAWANEIRLIRERDGYTHEEIRSLFAWVSNHYFWKGNILSPAKLRKQWDTLEIQKKSNSNGNGNGYRSQAEINSASTGQVVI